MPKKTIEEGFTQVAPEAATPAPAEVTPVPAKEAPAAAPANPLADTSMLASFAAVLLLRRLREMREEEKK